MNGVNVFASHRPIQQIDTNWTDVIKIEDSNDSEVIVNEYFDPERFPDAPNSYICHQQLNDENMRVEIVRMAAGADEIVKEEYQLNDKYDVVQVEEMYYDEMFAKVQQALPSAAKNQENVNFSNDQNCGVDRSTNPLQIINNNTLDTHVDAKPASQMEENAHEIIDAADQILKSYDFDTENRQVEADQCSLVLPNDEQSKQHTTNDAVHSMVSIEDYESSSESDVDSFVMIDLTLDREEIDEKITYVIDSSENEGEHEQQPMEQEHQMEPKEQENAIERKEQEHANEPKERKRKRKRKSVKMSETRSKKQKTVTDSKEPKYHKCAMCHYSTTNKAHFARHVSTHSSYKRHKCKICTKLFRTSKTLTMHMKLHDREQESFQCSVCRREFPREKPWKSHENKCKKGLRMYECYVCKEIVHNKNHLLKHMRSHTGKTNHCPKCKKQFASKIGVIHHMKKHADSFAFQCKKCLRVFSRQDRWQFHESRCKIKQYKCKICNRIFVHTNHLKYHMQTYIH